MSCSARTVLAIYGMRNSHGREHVVDALEAVNGVTSVDVSMFKGRAVVEHAASCAPTRLLRAVADAGYGAETLTTRAARPIT